LVTAGFLAGTDCALNNDFAAYDRKNETALTGVASVMLWSSGIAAAAAVTSDLLVGRSGQLRSAGPLLITLNVIVLLVVGRLLLRW
jgi:hypothetical protein